MSLALHCCVGVASRGGLLLFPEELVSHRHTLAWKYCARVTTLASKSGCSFWIFFWRHSVSAWQLVSAS